MRTTLTALACSLILGLSIGIGQSVAGPDAQSAANPNRAVVKELKKLYRLQFDSQANIAASAKASSDKLREIDESVGHALPGDDAISLLKRICDHTDPSTYHTANC